MTKSKSNKKQLKFAELPVQAKNPNRQTNTSKIPTGSATNTTNGGTPSKSTQKNKNKKSNKQPKQNLPQFTVAQVDPFAPEAFGCKVPDMSTMPSACAFSRAVFSLSTTTVAGVGTAIRPRISYSIPNVPVTSTSWTWPTAFSGTTNQPNTLALQNAYTALRPVASGVRLSCRQAYTAASGLLHIAIIPDMLNGTTWSYPTTTAQMTEAPYYRQVPLADLIEDDIIITNKFTDETGWAYLDPNTPDTPGSNNLPASGWSVILIWLEGSASTANAIDIEQIVHWEGLVGPTGNAGIISATKALPYSPALLAATQHVVEYSEPVKVVKDSQEDTSNFWDDICSIFDTGVKIANGVATVLAMF